MDAQLFQTEIKRKLFHATALVYVAGLYLVPRRIFLLLLLILFVIAVAVEIIRLSDENIRAAFRQLFGSLLRNHELDNWTGATWMMLGVLVTTLMLPSVPLAATAILYLIFGDGVASLAGISLGGPHWGNSPKRISGSLACFTICLLVGTLMLRPAYGWNGIIIGALVATIVEYGFLKINDNFLIPVACSIVFILTYNLHTV